MPPEARAVEAVRVTRVHAAHGAEVRALDGVSMCVDRGEVVAVVGPSGSGKSTLLFLLGGLDTPDAGRVLVMGSDWQSMEGSDRARFRRRTCGFVIQGMGLLPQATATENVEVPLVLENVDAGERALRVADALARVGLERDGPKLPDQLSGGQQQRLAIARALIARPAVVLADEPTGNLDSATGQRVTQLLVEAAGEHGTAVVLVTHDPAVAAHADRVVELHSGRINGGARAR